MTALRALVLVTGCACAQAWGVPFDRAYLTAATNSMVKVEVVRADGGYSLGAGVAIDGDRVVTACHVVRKASAVAVLHAGERWSATGRVAAGQRDMCVLMVPRLKATPAALRDTAQLAIGEDVAAIGFGPGGGVFLSRGAVSRLHRYDSGLVVQGSAAFTSGASGGGLFDADGRLVGVLMFRMRGAGAQFFALPVEWIADLLESGAEYEPVDAHIAQDPFWSLPPDRLPYFLRANMLETEKRWADLWALAARWQADEPDNGEPAYLRGEVDTVRNRVGSALADFQDAVARDPTHALAWSEVVRASLRAQHPDLARRAYSRLTLLSAVLARRLADEYPGVFR
ncbi:MAG TPA: serine protease [Burkholderiales bacterium]|nr:serine protease [Burkholderiales bacterium]